MMMPNPAAQITTPESHYRGVLILQAASAQADKDPEAAAHLLDGIRERFL